MAQNLYEIEQIVLPRDEDLFETNDSNGEWSNNLLSSVKITLIKTISITAPPGIRFILDNGKNSSPSSLMIGSSGYFSIKIENEAIYSLNNLQINIADYNRIKNNGFIIVDIVGARGEIANQEEDKVIVYDGGVVEQ